MQVYPDSPRGEIRYGICVVVEDVEVELEVEVEVEEEVEVEVDEDDMDEEVDAAVTCKSNSFVIFRPSTNKPSVQLHTPCTNSPDAPGSEHVLEKRPRRLVDMAGDKRGVPVND